MQALAACLLVLIVMPHHKFGWRDVEVMVAAILLLVLISFGISYLWKRFGRDTPESN